ncbi:hypothetical protein GOODEAATRI_027111 [Goodea atripinnis]|uniref:Uncharacterized protein n=1 Tax=Goodea atripinnis TaxID=208336 RepID=A0ABV0NY69_9TELE
MTLTSPTRRTQSPWTESNVIPNTFKNLLDTSMLESDVVTRDASRGKVETVKFEAAQNCGFLWNTNNLGFVSDAKNLVQSVTMITDSVMMQFGARFDIVRDACMTALYASHIVCRGAMSRRISLCINQLVFAELGLLKGVYKPTEMCGYFTEDPGSARQCVQLTHSVPASTFCSCRASRTLGASVSTIRFRLFHSDRHSIRPIHLGSSEAAGCLVSALWVTEGYRVGNRVKAQIPFALTKPGASL